LKQGDVVILVQSTSFRLNEFRIRIELFARKLKTVEHVHLNRMPEEQWATWIDTLSFDPNVGGETGRELKKILDEAQTIIIECGDAKLTWQGGMEACKLNIGDYTGMENIGGTYPIGEVFTEAKELERTNGELKIYAFADENFLVKFYEPFTAIVKDGLIEAGPDAPKEFVDVLAKIRQDERALVREFGLGLNAAISRQKPLADITAFERVSGSHLSLGEKHGVYKKPGIPTKSRYHVDVFPAADRITADGKVIFEAGRFLP
jgi:leucyl aminopeptidase (aminopeptidase T)